MLVVLHRLSILGMVVPLLIATEWRAAAGPVWAVRTVTVPC